MSIENKISYMMFLFFFFTTYSDCNHYTDSYSNILCFIHYAMQVCETSLDSTDWMVTDLHSRGDCNLRFKAAVYFQKSYYGLEISRFKNNIGLITRLLF